MKRIEIYALISGLVFLLSGVAKAIDISVFQNTIGSYGLENLRFTAPLIALAEIVLGLSLVLQIWQKWSAFAGAVLVTCLTGVYIYGLRHGVEDCGCFGKFTLQNSSPTFTFVRNTILVYLLAAVWWRSETKLVLNKWNIMASLTFIAVAAFMAGFTYDTSGDKPTPAKAIAMRDSKLREFVSTSCDSTYLVFAFSYTCPHCLNSIANLKEYESSGAVDRVIGLAMGDSIAEKRFVEIFKPNFSVINYSDELLRLTNEFPTAYYIRNDSIVVQSSGEIPCTYIFNPSAFPAYL
jgi:uncharacterized membrane protein YphA (DoxX/SURF4 family)